MTAELVLGQEEDAVPRARAFVRSFLGTNHGAVLADAELVVSELVTNATLHGVPPVRVRLTDGTDLVRVEVQDRGHNGPLVMRPPSQAMTGRGLAVVAALSSRWGVEPTAGEGKVVWAEILPTEGDTDGRVRRDGPGAEPDVDALLATWGDEQWPQAYLIDLGHVSTELLLAAKSHIDNVVRELTLLGRGQGPGQTAPEIADLVHTVTVGFSDVRSQLKRLAAAAAARGEPMTRLQLHVPARAADAGERYLAALEEADRYARSARLLTLAPPRAHRLFREWYVRALAAQVRSLSHGRPAPAVRPLDAVLAGELTSLGAQAEAAGRLAALQQAAGALAGATTAEEMAAVVVGTAMQCLGVESARVRLLTEGSMLQTVAWRTRGPAHAEPYPAYPLEADLPGARAVRERRAISVLALDDAFRDHPRLARYYPAGRNAHIVPLVAGDLALGLLSLTFVSGELTSQAELDLVQSLAHTLGQSLGRAKLAAAEAGRRRLVRDVLAGLAPQAPPEVPGFEVVALSLPDGAIPGGSWWELHPLADGTFLVGVGDAARSGPAGVPQMAELRYGARALAPVVAGPADLLDHLGNLGHQATGTTAGPATAFYGVLAPATGTLTWANAGHPAPLLLSPGSRPGSLGPAGPAGRRDRALQLPPGGTLVLYGAGLPGTGTPGAGAPGAGLPAEAAGLGLEELADRLVRAGSTIPVRDYCLLLLRRRP